MEDNYRIESSAISKSPWRNLIRHKFFSAINIFRLAIGITFSLLIGVYMFNQYNINRSLKNANDQYIIKSSWKVKKMGLNITTFGPLVKTRKEEYPGLVANFFYSGYFVMGIHEDAAVLT